MKKFDVTTWKNEIRASLPEFERKAKEAEKAFDKAGEIWRESGYSHECYEQYKEADHEMYYANKALENARLLALDQLYCNQYFYTDRESVSIYPSLTIKSGVFHPFLRTNQGFRVISYFKNHQITTLNIDYKSV